MWRVLPVFFLLAASGVSYSSAGEQVEYVVADRTIAIDRRPWDGKGNLRPWDRVPKINSDGQVTEVISNSCGFAQVTYRAQSIESFLARSTDARYEIDVAASMGEWCRLRHLIVDSDELLYLRNWHGQYFLEASAPILDDSQHRPFVVGASFIEYGELEHLTVALEINSESQGCFAKSELTAEAIEELKTEADLVDTPDLMCFQRGIYLDSLTSPRQVPRKSE